MTLGLGIVISSTSWSAPQAAVSESEDLLDLPLQALVQMDVFKSANLLPEQPAKAPGTVYSFGPKDFKRFGVRTLEGLLQFVPGIQLNQYRKRHQSIWARGNLERYNDKLVLLVDGIRRQRLYYGHFSLGDELPLEQIEKVEIILGPASSLYGASAYSGLISVTTKGFSDSPKWQLTAEGAQNDRSKTTVQYSDASVSGFASYLTQDAPFRADRKSFIGGTTLQPLDEEYRSLSLKIRPLDGLTLMADYTAGETPFLFIPDSQDAYVDTENWSLAAAYTHGDLEQGRIEANLYYQQDRVREFELEQLTNSLGYLERQYGTMAGASATALKQIDDHVVGAGATWRYEQAQAMDFVRHFSFAHGFLPQPLTGELLNEPGIINNDIGLFFQDVWTFTDAFKLTSGVRYDAFEHFDNYFNYRVAGVYSPSEAHTWKLLYGTAIRTPTFREYLKVLESPFVPEDLQAEKLRSLELAYRYQQGRWDNTVTLFHNTMKDFIREMPTPDGRDEYYSNTSYSMSVNGIENVIDVKLSDRLDARLGLSYLQMSSFKGMTIPYLAHWTGSISVSYRWAVHHQLGMALFTNSDRDDVNRFADDEAKAFQWVNLFATGELHKNLEYQFGVDNLLDKRVMDPAADFGRLYNPERSRRITWLKLIWTPEW